MPYEVYVVFSTSSGIPSLALAVNALYKAGGNVFPRFAARRRMP
jgi:uridine phosphorylase